MEKKNAINKEYVCQWCRHVFKQTVGYVQGNTVSGSNPPQPGKRASLSDQVKCRKCGNFMRTWDKIDLGDGKSIKVRR